MQRAAFRVVFKPKGVFICFLPTNKTNRTNREKRMAELILKEKTYKIIGACFEVYNQTGFGFTEPIYQECLAHELSIQKIPYVAQAVIPMSYKGLPLTKHFVADFICFDRIIVEIKSASSITDAHRAQLLNYMHATNYELGLLVNFGQYPKLQYERLICNRRNSTASRYEVIGQ
jgi:GxxExxY protein